MADARNTRNLTAPTFDASGHVVLSFGRADVSRTHWVLKRSTDLSPGSFQEIYRYDGTTDTAAPGVSHQRITTEITITDSNPPSGQAFYRFEAVLQP